MAKFLKDESRTFSEFLLVPNYSSKKCIPDNVSLLSPLSRFKKGKKSDIYLKTPMVSASMQAVSDDKMAIALAKEGGLSFIFCSQSIESQAEMIRRVKLHKAGFVESDSNITPDSSIDDLLKLIKKTGHSTVAVTDDGTGHGKLLGLITSRDYRPSHINTKDPVSKYMTPIDSLIVGKNNLDLSECNNLIWNHKLNTLPIIDKKGRLHSMVFRKDYEAHKENPNELLDDDKRYLVGAGINTHDYKERVPALIEAGAHIFCIDSSEGFTEFQKETIKWIKNKYGKKVIVGAGNVVDGDGFKFLADAGADFVKIGIGGGSICITRETKGIGRGQASALIDVAQARDKYFKRTGEYIPICSDGGIVQDYHITLALAMGADFIMLGRYFSRFEESPTSKININGMYYKEYWGEGSNRARNFQRYGDYDASSLRFEEGVDSYVPYAGSLKDNLSLTIAKVKSTMCNCGALNLNEFKEKARITVVSSTSITEGGAHDVLVKNQKQ